MKIIIESIPHQNQRYSTPGDYFYEGDTLIVKVSDLGDDRMNLLVALHEIIEEATSRNAGITEQEIMDFDLMYEKEREQGLHSQEDEPGWDPRSPYREYHAFAEKIERMACKKLGIKWSDYNEKFSHL